MAKDTNKLIADQAKEIASLKTQLKQKETADTNLTERQLDLNKSLVDALARQLEIKDEIAKSEDYVRIAVEQKQKFEKRADHDLFVKFKKIERNKKIQLDILRIEQESIKATIDQTRALSEQTKLLIKRQEYGEKYSDTFASSLNFLDDIESSIKTIPIAGDFLSKAIGIDGLKEKMVKKFEEGWNTVKTGVSETSSAMGDVTGGVDVASMATKGFGISMSAVLATTMSIGAVIALFKKALSLDQEVTDLAKGLGIVKKDAVELNNQLIDIASNTRVVGADTKALTESYTELANSLGVSVLASKDLAETQVYLKNQIGLSADEAIDFQKFSMLSGKSSEQNLAVIKTAVDSLTGGLLNYKSVTKDIAKASKAVQASYKGNIDALVKATIQAKKFGMTLDEAKALSDGILNIEESIGAEMTANVLTGKHVNLNTARQLALQGDVAAAAAETLKQVGSYDELMQMAPYQQKSLADAAGLTTEQLIKSAEEQKNINSIAESLGITLKQNEKLTDKQIAQAAALGNSEAKQLAIANQQAAAQEKLAQLGNKLTLIFAKVATPLMEILDPLMEMIDTLFPAIQTAIEIAFFPLRAAASLLSGIVKIFTGNDLTKSSKNISQNVADNVDSMQDGIVNSKGLVVKSPKGTYSLDENDSIIAGTNLTSTTTNNTATNNNSRLESLLEKLIAKVDQPVYINMGGKVIDELDNRITLRKTYTTKVDGGYGVFG